MAEGRRRQAGKRGKAVKISRMVLLNRPNYNPKEFGFYPDYNMSH